MNAASPALDAPSGDATAAAGDAGPAGRLRRPDRARRPAPLFVLATTTEQTFAWTIQPPLTAAFLGAGYARRLRAGRAVPAGGYLGRRPACRS